MNNIKSAIERVRLAPPLAHDGLSMHPLLCPQPFAKDYLTLDEALAAATASVTEVSAGGAVPQLLLRNMGGLAVFLLDGEELVGAKQNRILNISILAPAHKDTVIPVSCVEAGRWSHSRPDFTAAPRAQFAASRAKRAAYVSEDISACGLRRGNQGEVWQDVSAKLESLGSRSPTQAVDKAFVDHAARLDEYVDGLSPVADQAGAIFCIKGRVVGMELFDSQETCRLLLPKIIRSYALDAIDPQFAANERFDEEGPEPFLRRIAAAEVREAPAVGEGVDIRFDSASGLAGGSLLARDRVVHLVAFALREPSLHGSERVYRGHRI